MAPLRLWMIKPSKSFRGTFNFLLSMMIIIIIIELGPQINESSLWGWIDCISGGAVASLAPAEAAHICSMTTTFILDFAVWNHWPAPKLTHGFPHSITDHILSIIIPLQCMFVEQFTVFFSLLSLYPAPSIRWEKKKKKKKFSSFSLKSFVPTS